MDDLKYCETSGIICTLPFTMSAILSFQGLCIAATSLLLTTDTYTVNRQSGPFGLGTCMERNNDCLLPTKWLSRGPTTGHERIELAGVVWISVNCNQSESDCMQFTWHVRAAINRKIILILNRQTSHVAVHLNNQNQIYQISEDSFPRHRFRPMELIAYNQFCSHWFW